MRSRIAAVALITLLACIPLAQAKGPQGGKQIQQLQPTERSNGTFGNLSMSGGQSGPLEITMNVSATTAGDGSNTALNIVFLEGQVYNGLWTTQTWTSLASETHANSSPGGSFSSTFTFTVPAPDNYAIWSLGFAGILHGTSTGGGYCAGDICYTQQYLTCCYPVSTGDLFYVDSTQPPTPTPDLEYRHPVPTLNTWGVAAMVVLLAGIAVLVLMRRRG